MTSRVKIVKYIYLILALQLIYSCHNDNAKFIAGTNSVVNHLENDSSTTLFLQAIEEAGFDSELDANSGSNTILIPNNKAILAFLEGQGIEDLRDLPRDDLRAFVRYHWFNDLFYLENFSTGYMPTQAEIPITDSTNTFLAVFVNQRTDSLLFNGQTDITRGDVEVDNGILHFINRALALPTISTFMTTDPELLPFYKQLLSAKDTLSRWEDLADPKEQVTVFTPTQLAVEEFLKDRREGDSDFENLLKYHFLKKQKSVETMPTGYYPTQATEEYSGQYRNLSLYIDTDAEMKVNKEAAVITPDLRAINGNIEVIDQFLRPLSLIDVVNTDKRLSLFKERLENDEELWGLLKNPDNSRPYTIFAPTDEAVERFLKEEFPEADEVSVDSIPSEEWRDILEAHIVDDNVLASEGAKNKELRTLNGTMLRLTTDGISTGNLQEEGKLMVSDIQTRNGMIHIIDRVLRPED